MNYKIITLLIAFILSVSAGFAQTLQLEAVTDAAPGTVEVKLDMSGFSTNIGSATIYIAIDTDLLTYTGGNMPFGGGTILANTDNGELKLSWFNMAGVSANGTFAVLEFDYAGALPTDLVFNQTTAEIATVNGTIIPISTFIDGSITPTTTTVGKISLADIEVASVGSSLEMPLTANAIGTATDFEQVTAFDFKISYDPAKLAYDGVADNIPGMVVNSSNPGIIMLSWSDMNPVDLSNNYLLANLNLTYLGGGVANLNFNSGIVNTTNPVAIELVNGSVRVDPAGPTQGVLTLPEIYTPANTMVSVPLNVADITDPVSVISLNLNYDASKLTYAGYTANQLSGWVVNVNQSNGSIAAYYTNATVQTITDGSLLSFNFNYTSGEAALAFAPGTAMQTTLGNFLNLELIDGFVNNIMTINASPNNADYGSVTGGGAYEYGDPVTLEAIPVAGYSFVNWTEDGSPVSTDAIYTFTATTARDLVANFVANDYELTLTASPESSGTLTGAGTYAFGSSVTVEATAADGYAFVNWTKGATEMSTDPVYTFSMPAEDLALTANFVVDEHTLTLVSSPEEVGYLTGGGVYAAGTEVDITATANAGFQFVNWTDNDGEVSAYADFTYTMPHGDVTLTANFIPVYSISGKVKYANTTGPVRPINTNVSSTTEVVLFESDGTTEIARTNTDINGDYSFTALPPGDYVVSAETDKPWGASGVNLADYAITKSFVNSGTPILQGIYWLAADVNSNGVVNLADYALIRNRVNTSSTAGWSGSDWIFEKVSVNVTNQSIIDSDILGIISGDVNASYQF